jgi:predicted nucleic acid-binding Zn ribbon protein
MSKKNKIYWLEGVTEKGVKSLLNDENSKFSWLRRQRNRRALVLFMAMGIIFTALGSYHSGLKEELRLDGSAEIVWLTVAVLFILFAVLIGYSLLRIAVRGIADAPTELLDERQVRVRDTSYRYAYLISGYLLMTLLLLYFFGPEISLFGDKANDGSYLLIATLFAYASLPSMVIAWRERDI